MASFGKLQAALASATNEVTVAAANINFDFTLVKYEAPKEFHALGSSLSQLRVNNAESGPIHITARRLGSLFDGITPSTPCLLRAYGSRASEIAIAAKDTTTPEPDNSAFAAYHGVDGTSIWAAATSSKTALHVQLLACMLARVWPASEATSVWYELVKERRREIERKWTADEALPFSALTAAAQSEITRASLAEWDASARSWLRTADRVKTKDQDQLMIFIANLNVPINIDQEVEVYESVVAAWKSALISVEKIIRGEPQAVNNGACLLALSSWHLYPDVLITSSMPTAHHFRDPLLSAGGTLTLGLAPPGGNNSRAAFWSLSLAHMSYYGRPIKREAELDMSSKAITFDQFTVVVFGALLWQWGFDDRSAELPARFFKSLQASINRATGGLGPDDPGTPARDIPMEDVQNLATSDSRQHQNPRLSPGPAESDVAGGLKDPSHGLNIFYKISAHYLEVQTDREDSIHKLIALGSRKATKFVPNADSHGTFFGLESPLVIMKSLKGLNERISYLRRIAVSTVLPQEAYYIRYFADPARPNILGWDSGRQCGIATIFDEKRSQYSPDGLSPSRTYRWAPKAWHENFSMGLTGGEPHSTMDTDTSYRLADKQYTFTMLGDGSRSTSTEHNNDVRTYVIVYGDPNSAALFVDQSLITHVEENESGGMPNLTNSVELAAIGARYKSLSSVLGDLIWGLDENWFNVTKLVGFMTNLRTPVLPQAQLLFSLSTAHRIYRAIPNSTLSTRALNRPLHLTKWGSQAIRQFLDSPTSKVHKTTAFACVAYMETGLDIEPSNFSRVFAVAYEDSIYVTMQLSCDPWDVPEPFELRRIAGNIGKPGLTLLVPPIDPMMAFVEESSWRLVSSTPFNGLPENAFSKASMHLTFTEYYRALTQSDMVQGQDNQVFLQESIISVHNSGVWVGDVDVQGCLDSSLLTRRGRVSCCGRHEQWDSCLEYLANIVSIENWDDILDPPRRDMVVRAHGSWVARLATTLICIQAQRSSSSGEKPQDFLGGVLIFPNESCWKCLCMATFLGLYERRLNLHATSLSGPVLTNVIVF